MTSNEDQVLIRAIVNRVEAGAIIGKGGKNMEHLRNFGVKAVVSKNTEGSDDRIVTISGTLYNVINVKSLIANLSHTHLHILI